MNFNMQYNTTSPQISGIIIPFHRWWLKPWVIGSSLYPCFLIQNGINNILKKHSTKAVTIPELLSTEALADWKLLQSSTKTSNSPAEAMSLFGPDFFIKHKMEGTTIRESYAGLK